MKVKDQIKFRREQLGISIMELSRRLNTSDQTVRYWEDGRNEPSKRISKDLERELSMSIDWSEGGHGPFATELLHNDDMELTLQIGRLDPQTKEAVANLVRKIAESKGARMSEAEPQVTPASSVPVKAFATKTKSDKPHVPATRSSNRKVHAR